jgi:hypothetical protein
VSNQLIRFGVFTVFAQVVGLGAVAQAQAQGGGTTYPSMAPVEQYLIVDRNAEIALARSAAPKSISDSAEVLVLGRHAYETAVKGTNGFVCTVFRSWTAGSDDPDFWNPKLRAPICFNAPAARSYLPIMVERTRLVLGGKPKAQVFETVRSEFEKKQLPALEPDAMCYMMSKQGYLGDRAGHWHPHLMFFVPSADAKAWGADLPGSPIIEADDPANRLTVFLIPVAKWSDGTADADAQHVH